MVTDSLLSVDVKLDYPGLIRNLKREGTPEKVYVMELFQDRPIEIAIDRAFGVTKDLVYTAPNKEWQRRMEMQRFFGYEYMPVPILSLPCNHRQADDTTDGDQALPLRNWMEESKGPITSWEEFETYPWPDGKTWNTEALEWFEKNLPDDMCLVGRGGQFCEYLCWLMGYESLCYALYEQPDLIRALADKIMVLEEAACKILLQSKRVKIFWSSDDMGFKTSLMISPEHMRQYVLPGHKRLAELTHEAGHPYLLHACGKREAILEDLIEDVKLDGIHSWEDNIELITDAKKKYGHRISLLGGIDMDFLCRAGEEQIRRRVRETVEICQPGGGFCLGSGNSVSNYIPMQNYLVMLDEARRIRF